MNGNLQTTITTEVNPSIMPDKGSWQFTDGQIALIKKHDINAITEFYNANYKILLGMAHKFVLKKRYINNYAYSVDDCMQQVFVDLPYYNFSTRANLYCNIIYGTFWRSNDGGITTSEYKVKNQSLMISYDKPINDNGGNESGSYLLDKLIISAIPHEELLTYEEIAINDKDRNDKDKAICAYLERTISNKRDLNAMFCKLFTDLPLNQIKGDEYEYFKQFKN